MLDTIGNLLGDIAVYIAALLGLVALYFLWVAFREWRSGRRAMFGVERDIAASEMMGSLGRAAIVIFVGLVVLGLGQLGKDETSDETTGRTTQPTPPTAPVAGTPTPGPGGVAPTLLPTDTPQAMVTDIPPLPSESTATSAAEPTPQTATVNAVGGVWLRDAPNGGTIGVLPQGSVVQFLEGREFVGSYDWQRVRVLNTPAGGEALVNQEGWVALQFLETGP
jgi:hypothetical protein